MRSAIIKDGEVINVIKGSIPGSIECPPEVGIGWTYDGSTFTPPPNPEPELASPVTRIERRQGLRALLSQGIKRADIEAMISAIEDETEREIALAEYEHTHWTIESPFIAQGAAHFGMSEEQVQALFEHAATL